MSSKIIFKSRFLEHGSPPPKGSRYKGTINTVSIIGWIDYLNRKEANDATKSDKLILSNSGYLGYTSRNDFVTFSKNGLIDEEIVKEQVNKSFNKNGNIIYDCVLSFKDYDFAGECNINDAKDAQCLIKNNLPKYFKDLGLEQDNVFWWGNYHTDKKNPHLHICFLEKEQTRTKGTVPRKALKKMKNNILQTLLFDKNFSNSKLVKKYYESVDPKNTIKKTIKNNFTIFSGDNDNIILSDEIDNSLQEIFDNIKECGRLQYNSLNQKGVKNLIDKSIELILNNENYCDKYKEFLNHLDNIEDLYKEVIGRSANVGVKENELKKLYSLLGNNILQNLNMYELIKKGQNVILQVPNYLNISDVDKNQHKNILRIKKDDSEYYEFKYLDNFDGHKNNKLYSIDLMDNIKHCKVIEKEEYEDLLKSKIDNEKFHNNLEDILTVNTFQSDFYDRVTKELNDKLNNQSSDDIIDDVEEKQINNFINICNDLQIINSYSFVLNEFNEDEELEEKFTKAGTVKRETYDKINKFQTNEFYSKLYQMLPNFEINYNDLSIKQYSRFLKMTQSEIKKIKSEDNESQIKTDQLNQLNEKMNSICNMIFYIKNSKSIINYFENNPNDSKYTHEAATTVNEKMYFKKRYSQRAFADKYGINSIYECDQRTGKIFINNRKMKMLINVNRKKYASMKIVNDISSLANKYLKEKEYELERDVSIFLQSSSK